MSGTETPGLSLPKLPELAKEDVDAVRNFLPGKILGRTAALLSLVLLVLGFAVLVDQGLKRLLNASLPLTQPQQLGLPLLVVGVQVYVEWRAGRVRRQLQALAVQPGAVPHGYFRVGPYLDTAEDRAKFDRADQAHRKVLDWLKRSAHVPLYLTGDSGSGKSSLLNASVLPALRDEGWTVVEVRAWQDPEAALRDALVRLPNGRRPRAGEEQDRGLRELMEGTARRAGAGLLIVLDQFEEFLILGKKEQHDRFSALLPELRADPVQKLRLLLTLRSDYQHLLDDLGLPPLRHGDNHHQIGRFTLGAATKFMTQSGLGLQPEALDRLLTSAATMDETPGLVRPITLNVLGYVLTAGQGAAPSLDAGELVRLYIERTIGQPAIRDHAVTVLERLLTEQGTKQPRSEQDLMAATGLRRAEVRGVLNALSASALARPLDAAQAVWELSHDFIARAVARHLGRRRRDSIRRVAFYAAPMLLALTVLIGGGVVARNAVNAVRPLQVHSELAELGITVIPAEGRWSGERNSRLTQQSLVKAGPLLSSLVGDAALTRLDLSDTPVFDLSLLAGTTALESLALRGTRASDLAPLRDLATLKKLDLSNSPVSDLAPLARMAALTYLDLSVTPVSDLAPLRDLAALESLALRGTPPSRAST